MQEVAGIAVESASTPVWRLEFCSLDQVGLLVQTLCEDLLDRAVLGRTERQCACARRLEPATAVLVTQPEQPLGGPQVIEYAIAKQNLDECQTGRTDVLGLLQAPLRLAHQVGLCVGR